MVRHQPQATPVAGHAQSQQLMFAAIVKNPKHERSAPSAHDLAIVPSNHFPQHLNWFGQSAESYCCELVQKAPSRRLVRHRDRVFFDDVNWKPP